MGKLGRDRDQRGAAALEFALVLPILLLLLFGAIQYGLYFWALQGGADAARYAARLSAVGNPSTCSAFRSEVQSSIGPYRRGAATITRSYSDGPSHVGSGVQIGDTVTIQVSFSSIDLHIPMVPFLDNGHVSQRVTTRVDYVPTQPEACS